MLMTDEHRDTHSGGAPTWPRASGEMADRVRAFDWAATPLGPAEKWPASLKHVAELTLAAPFASVLLWGPEHIIAAYNSGYRTILNDKPEALGRPALDVWAEERELLAPQLARVLAGETLSFKELPMSLERGFASGQSWFDCGYGPVRDETGEVAGIVVTIREITHWMATIRDARDDEARQEFLLELSDALRRLADPAEVIAVASAMLGDRVGIDRCGYGEVDSAGETISFLAIRSAPGIGPLPDRLWFADFGDVIDVLRGGDTLVIEDVAADPRLADPALLRSFADTQIAATISVPLIKERRFVAALFAHQARKRTWTPFEIALIEAVAERTWAAVERARAEAARRESEERLRQFGDNSPDTLWIVDAAANRLEYLSPAYEHIWGEPRERVMNDLVHWREHVHPEDRALVAEGLPNLLAGERRSIEYRIVRPDGQTRWIFDTGFPIVDARGNVIRLAGVAQDLTARRHAEDQARRGEQRFRLLLEGIPQLVWRAVDHGSWSWASPQWTAFTGQSEQDSHGWGWLDMVHPDDRAAAREAWRRAMSTDTFAVEYRLRMIEDGRYRWFSTRATPVRDETGALIEWLGTSTDIHDLRRLQAHQHVLLGELQHRVRNSLAVIRSIARRTAETSESVEDFSLHLEGRLDAFARTQATVTRDPTGGIDLASIVADELLAHIAWEGEHTHVKGPEIKLRPKVGETLALAFHELASNAVKYGALSLPAGKIKVSWRVDAGDGGADQLVIVWDEHRPGGPLKPPTRRGFGTELLESTLAYELEADTLLDFRPTGLQCVIIIPLTDEIGRMV